MNSTRTDESDPNPLVREVYDKLGALLRQGDHVFIEEGPDTLKKAIKQGGFFENVSTDPAEPDEYTREKVIGDPGEHTIRFMEWPPEYALLPHEHHGRPCFEVLVEGQLLVTDFERTQLSDNTYEFNILDTTIVRPGDSAVIDPRENEVHSVYSPVRSKSLHVYPEDNWKAYGYVLQESENNADIYERKEFQLRQDDVKA
jgi:hypothetical protein